MVRKVSFFFTQLKKHLHLLILLFEKKDFKGKALLCLAQCCCRATLELLGWGPLTKGE